MPEFQTPTANSSKTVGAGARPSKRQRPLLKIVLAALILVCIISLPSPYAVERPGPVVNTLGEVTIDDEQQPVLDISGAEQFRAKGTLNLLTVNVQGSPDSRVAWVGLIWPLISPSHDIVPLTDIYPDGESSEDRKAYNEAQMVSSQDVATAAALRELDYQVPGKVTVGQVGEDAPATGVLEPKDEIVRVNGAEINGLGTLREAIQAAQGEALEITFIRDEGAGEQNETITPTQLATGEWVLGVTVGTEYDFPVEVDIVLDQIGGPSAGMIFSLSIIDELTPGELTRGHVISGTGTIDDAGHVGGIGGLTQKMYAAARADTELFLMPQENCGTEPKSIPGDMTVAVVDTLDDAQSAIQKFADDEPVPGLEICDAK
ncbi:MAG: YlbL family protein [Canibacter sp.]